MFCEEGFALQTSLRGWFQKMDMQAEGLKAEFFRLQGGI
jgi:hypothetical protein